MILKEILEKWKSAKRVPGEISYRVENPNGPELGIQIACDDLSLLALISLARDAALEEAIIAAENACAENRATEMIIAEIRALRGKKEGE